MISGPVWPEDEEPKQVTLCHLGDGHFVTVEQRKEPHDEVAAQVRVDLSLLAEDAIASIDVEESAGDVGGLGGAQPYCGRRLLFRA